MASVVLVEESLGVSLRFGPIPAGAQETTPEPRVRKLEGPRDRSGVASLAVLFR